MVHQAAEHVAFALIASAHQAGAADDDLVICFDRQGDLDRSFDRLVLVEDEVGVVAAKTEIADRGATGRFTG